jgi:hypothetical protein
MNYRVIKRLGLAALFAAFSGCKIQIDVPAGGIVVSESGKYKCDSGQTCVIDVYDALFDETFVPIPDQGFRFSAWKKRERGLCGGKDEPCWLPTTGFPGHDVLMDILESDEVFYLTPEFGRGRDPCSFEFWEIENARLSSTYMTREVTTGPQCEGRTIGIGAPGNYLAQYSLDGGSWRSAQSDIQPGQTIRVRISSAETFDTTRTALLTIGDPTCFRVIDDCLWVLDGGSSEIKVTTRPGDPLDAPEVIVTYPLAGQEVDASVLRVTGTATDEDGVQEVLVNGVRATSFDGFLTWQADVPLQTGSNSLVIESADKFLNRNSQVISLKIENTRIVFEEASAITLENDSGNLYVVDTKLGDVIVVDVRTDDWRIVSSSQDAQIDFVDPRRIVVNQDQTQAWILDRGYTDIISVDLLTGERALFRGTGESLEDMRDLALDSENRQILVLLIDPGSATATTVRSGGIVSVDLETGTRSLISDNTIPHEEPGFFISYSILFDTVRDQLLVVQRNSILGVDPILGQRQTLIDYRSLEPSLATIDEMGGRIIVGRGSWPDRIYELVEIDLESGDSKVLLPTRDYLIPSSTDIAIDSKNNRLFYSYGEHVGMLNLDTGKNINEYY